MLIKCELRIYVQKDVVIINKMIMYLDKIKVFIEHINKSPWEMNASLPFETKIMSN